MIHKQYIKVIQRYVERKTILNKSHFIYSNSAYIVHTVFKKFSPGILFNTIFNCINNIS